MSINFNPLHYPDAWGLNPHDQTQGDKPLLWSSEVANQQLEMKLLTAREEWG